MIELDALSVRAGAFELANLDLRVDSGAYVVLMGRTGSGKTTLLETLCGLRPAAGGAIRLHGRDVTRENPATRGIGFVPQDRVLFETMTVAENLAFALDVRRRPRAEVAARVQELAQMLGIAALLDRRPQGLSGGEQQRVALGRALADRPALLLLDEPLSALDLETRGDMIEMLRRVRRQTGVTTLHVTHSRDEARALADRVLVIEGQTLVERPTQGDVAPADGYVASQLRQEEFPEP
jgi:ABC-type sugar transport system ATPase subunit